MQTYYSILDDIAFRIAILDTTKKTAEIALAYHVSVSHVRTLRAKHGRPYVRSAHYDTVVSRKWQSNAELVHDVRTMRVKEVMRKHRYCMSSVIEMRRQLGIAKQQILRSKEFRHAVKTRSCDEVAAMFGLGLSVVSKYRVRFGVAKTKGNGDEIAVAACDLDWCYQYKNTLFDFDRYRRPEVYQRITGQR